MKKIFGKLLMGIAVISLILSILAWIAGITTFSLRLFVWYKTGEWHRPAIIEFIPDSWIVKATTTWPGIQENLLWILNREVISSFIEFCLLLIFIFFIMYIGAKWCQEKPREQEKSEIILNRLKKLTRNK
jgi:hypothetical protein